MADKQHDCLVFFCNGKKIVEPDPNPDDTLLSYIRNKLQLTGSKEGCGVGACGACTVMISSADPGTNKIDHIAVNACLFPLCGVHGKAVTTVEGIGNTRTKLHAVQERIAKAHGSQCGFCTPGMVMSMYALLRTNAKPDGEQLIKAMEGNLCRCTGYRPILSGFETFTKKQPCGDNCLCVNGSTNMTNGQANGENNEVSASLRKPKLFADYDPSQDLIFPPELSTMSDDLSKTAWFCNDDVKWVSVGSLQELLVLKSKHPAAPIMAGNTALGIQKKFAGFSHPLVLAPNHVVHELHQINITDTGLEVGSMVTMSQLSEACQKCMNTLPKEKLCVLETLMEILNRFAGEQIRNVATIGGNLKAAQPHSDLNSFFLAAGCSLTIAADKDVKRTLPLSADFFPSRWKTSVANDEIIVNINIPFSKKDEYIYVYKVARRNSVDTAIVNSVFKVILDGTSSTVKDMVMVFGGIAATTKVATDTSRKLVGMKWNRDMLTIAYDELVKELTLDPTAPGGMVHYRHTLIVSSFYKFYIDVLRQAMPEDTVELPSSTNSVIRNFNQGFPRGTQVYQPVPEDQSSVDPIGRPVVHNAAFQQTTGEAEYVDDVPPEQGETYFGLVMSKRVHAKIISIDTTAALSCPGVVCYVGAEDVPGENVFNEAEIFASEKVEFSGQIIGGIVASSPEIARKAAKMVRVEYENLPPIVTIEEAIENQSFFPSPWSLEKGNVEETFQTVDHVIEGVINIGGQEHFYIETNGCLAKPKEDGEMDIHAPVQWPNNLQAAICAALGEKANRIRCHVKRIGGAFGGKIYPAGPHTACAVAARKCGKPVRMILSRTEDMAITGNRQPTFARYKAGFMSNGKVKALKVDAYGGAGISPDCTPWVMSHLLFNLDSVYSIDSISATATSCKTNKPSNTAFRGYGAPEAIHIIENIMYDVATVCQLSQIQVQEMNFHREEVARTYYGSELDDFETFPRCWKECLDKSNYNQRRRMVDLYNTQNRWTKRGIALTPNKHLVGMFPIYKLQGGATVSVFHTDGSVILHHGGVEMGQGISTKMVQVASRVLGIPCDLIYCQETSTHSVANQTSTSASVTTDRIGFAVKDACEILAKRLLPYRKSNPDGTWKDWVDTAYHDRVNLAAIGFYKSNPEVNWSWKTKTGRPYVYPVYGAACSEVEVDCLTGAHRVLRTDLVIDIGRSINPALDIGQIEGGFMQAYGLLALEDHRWSPEGWLLTNGPHAYKIPTFMDIPTEFNVTLFRNSKNERAVYSSKGVGEAPLSLANSVFFAIKDAIQSARADNGLSGTFTLDSPAVGERVRLACGDSLLDKFPVTETGPKHKI